MVDYWKIVLILGVAVGLWFGIRVQYTEGAANVLIFGYILLSARLYEYLGKVISLATPEATV